MNPTKFQSKTTPYRLQIPGRYFPDKKRKTEYFKTLKAAKERCQEIKQKGAGAFRQVPAEDLAKYAPLIAAAIEKLGIDDPGRLFEAIDHYQKTRLNVTPMDVGQAMLEFRAKRKTEVGHRTWSEEKYRLNKLMAKFEFKPMSEITETDLRKFFDGIPGKKKSIFKSAQVFFKWAIGYNLVGQNPIANIQIKEATQANKEIYSPAIFERMLRVAAGLEGPRRGTEPTREFLPLLPWFVISGLCGLRSREVMRTRGGDAIRWTDLHFDQQRQDAPAGFIEVRPEVAKQTQRRTGNRRFIKAVHHLEAAKAWLELCPREHETIVPRADRGIYALGARFETATGIQLVENGLRNSFASYTLTMEGLAGVGALAIEMGNSEAIAKQFYIESLEPGLGRAWFNIRPDRPANIIPIQAVSAA